MASARQGLGVKGAPVNGLAGLHRHKALQNRAWQFILAFYMSAGPGNVFPSSKEDF
jgi:hypothetical protein